MRVSKYGLNFIASFEGWSAKLYNDIAGHATIGYGHLVHKGPINGSEPAEFKAGITKERGLELLAQDASTAESAVNNLVAVPLTQEQFDALVSFTFNLGEGNLRKSSVLRELNLSNYEGVPGALAMWNKAGGKVSEGLTRRRAAEGLAFS